jgi:hypothetical protein
MSMKRPHPTDFVDRPPPQAGEVKSRSLGFRVTMTPSKSLFGKFAFPGVPGALRHEVTPRRRGIVAENLANDPGSAAHRFTLRCVRGTAGRYPVTFQNRL